MFLNFLQLKSHFFVKLLVFFRVSKNPPKKPPIFCGGWVFWGLPPKLVSEKLPAGAEIAPSPRGLPPAPGGRGLAQPPGAAPQPPGAAPQPPGAGASPPAPGG